MGNSVKELVEIALITALRERKKFSDNKYLPFCLFDYVEKQGVDIKFVEIPSFEAMYSKDPGPLILLSSLRPHGRQYFNCAHEYGHHIFSHGMKLDELKENYGKNQFDPDEFLVDTFAGFFLMPKSTIQRAFKIRGLEVNNFNPINYFKVASNLGVGYSTLAFHLFRSLQIIDNSLYNKLKNVSVKYIKNEMIGQEFPGEIIYVDEYWEGRPIDLQINDILVLESDAYIDNNLVDDIDFINGRMLLKGFKPGIGKMTFKKANHSHYLRVSRNKYTGFNKYKHLGE